MATTRPNILDRLATGRNALIGLGLIVLFNVVVMPGAQAALEARSGGVGPIDLEIGYTPDHVYRMIAAYGDDGRSFYLLSILTADTLYPLVYGLGLCLIITYLGRRVLAPGSPWRALRWLSLVGVLADLCENTTVITMVLAYPDQLVWAGTMANVFTLTKFAMVGSATLSALVLGIAALVTHVRRFRRRGPAS